MLGKERCLCLSWSGGCCSAQGSAAGQGIGAGTVSLDCPGTSCGDLSLLGNPGPVTIAIPKPELRLLSCEEWDVLITGDIHWRETWSQG